MWASHRPGLILKAKGWCFMRKRFNRGCSGGPKRGSETPPTPMSDHAHLQPRSTLARQGCWATWHSQQAHSLRVREK